MSWLFILIKVKLVVKTTFVKFWSGTRKIIQPIARGKGCLLFKVVEFRVHIPIFSHMYEQSWATFSTFLKDREQDQMAKTGEFFFTEFYS